MEKIRIKLPIIVEGRYDKNTLSQIFDCTVITTGGFSIFNSREKQALIKKLAEKGGVILLTDSDAGGRQIRGFLSKILPKEKIFNLYIPEIEGKERRKSKPSKEGYLGVEGMEREILTSVMKPFIDRGACEANVEKRLVTKMDLYCDGLSGKEDSGVKRELLAKKLGFPRDMSAKALIEAINLIYDYDKYKEAVSDVEESFTNRT